MFVCFFVEPLEMICVLDMFEKLCMIDENVYDDMIECCMR